MLMFLFFFFFKQKTAYDMRISDWSSDVCSSDLRWKYIENLHPDWTYTTHIDLKVRRTDSGAYFPSWREAADKDPVAKAIVDSYYKRPAEELYDLKADPDEKVNLAGDPRYAKQLAELRSRLAAWRKAQGDSGAVPVKPRFERGPMSGEGD